MKSQIRISSRLMVSALLVGLSVFGLTASGQEKADAKTGAPRYKDARLPVSDRVADLLGRMTLEEKVDQLSWTWQRNVQVVDPTGTFTTELARQTVASECLERG